MIILGWILFGGSHTILSSKNLRDGMVSKLGEKGFQGVYSLIAIAAFAFLIKAFYDTRSIDEPLLAMGSEHPAAISICNILMLFSFIFLFTGFFNRTPMGLIPGKIKAYGIVRITRHPMNMAFALFGIAHLLVNRTAADWIFYGGFILYGYIGSYHQDQKKAGTRGKEMADFIAETSILPFIAIISGRQPFKIGEISKIGILLGVVLAIVAKILHPVV